MKQPGTLWLTGGAISVAAHAAFLGLLVLAISPDPTPQQPMPKTRLDVAAYEVQSSTAARQTPPTDPAAQSVATGAALSDSVVAQSRAKPVPPAIQEVAAAASTATIAAPAVKPLIAKAEVPDKAATTARPVSASSVAVDSVTPPATLATASSIQSTSLLAAPQPTILATNPIQPVSVAAAQTQGDLTPLGRTEPAPTPGLQLAANAPRVADSPPAELAATAPALPPPSEKSTAALAWTGSDQGSVDPVSLAAIQAFMEPGDLEQVQGNADLLRDGIEGLLASVPCARLQTTFVPETGQLALRGHVPEEALKGPVVQALQARIGGDIRIDDQLLILPRPQCGALSGIAAVGLPQSTEQMTNPRIIGQNAHVREYAYAEGQRLEFDLTAPDYDAYVYVDYFDADGMVIHLQPNDIVPLALYGAMEPLSVGRETDGAPALDITIAPPFGQEIAVAFAASQSLYSDPRPLMEPADAYLDFLAERVADARTRDPGFKGEWVYFFISTHPGPVQTD